MAKGKAMKCEDPETEGAWMDTVLWKKLKNKIEKGSGRGAWKASWEWLR